MNPPTQTFEIRFDGLSVAEAGIKAGRLRRELLEMTPDVSVSLTKDDPSNMDFGATLVLVLGTPSAIAVAKGISSFLQRDRATITISRDGKVVATGIKGDDAARIAEAFAGHRKET